MLKYCNKIFFVQNKCSNIHAIEHLYKSVNNLNTIQPIYISTNDWNDGSFKEIIKNNSDTQSCVLPFQAVQELEVLLDEKIPLKWIHVIGTGIDNYKSLFQRLKNNNIIMTNTKGRSALLLAEFSILGSLYFAKNIPFINDLQQNKNWQTSQKFVDLMSNKNALIIGLGSIGGEIAKKCYYGFNMNIIGVKRNVNQLDNDLKSCVKDVISLDQIESTIQHIDYIYLAMPGCGIGEIINKNLIKKMKKGVVIVNVGRGDVINEDDLIWGAALDVTQEEPLNKDSQLYNDDLLKQRLLLTCHSMDYSEELSQQSVKIFKEVLQSVLNDEQPIKNTVNFELGYQIIFYKQKICI